MLQFTNAERLSYYKQRKPHHSSWTVYLASICGRLDGKQFYVFIYYIVSSAWLDLEMETYGELKLILD